MGIRRVGCRVQVVKAGIIDPTKVVRSALKHAASIGSLMAMVAERQEKSSSDGDTGGSNH
jgi:chaperonin GroEL